MITHSTVCRVMSRSVSIDGMATLTIATSRIVMKNAAPRTAASVAGSVRRRCRTRALPLRVLTACAYDGRTRSAPSLFHGAKENFRREGSLGSMADKLPELEAIYRARYPAFVRVALAIVRHEQSARDVVHDGFVLAVRNRN